MDMMQPKGKVCLSLGCGLGRFLRAYIGRCAKLVIGADLNMDNLFKCKQTGAYLVRCDIERLPIRGNSIEAMECVATVEHLPHPGRLVEEIRRISANNGISFVTWVSFDWSRALTDPVTRHRLLWKVRDAIFDLLPTAVTEKMVRLHIPFSGSYGIFRNKGFSLSDVSKTYEGAFMHITWSKKFSDENLIAVTALPARGRPT
jgi:ubiquinone/menaquinone biosynthesis C-methylase UbiE